MTSSDLRDVLELPVDGQSGELRAIAATRRQQRGGAIAKPSLKGLAREVQSLGGDNPIVIVPEGSAFKKRRIASRKSAARWNLSAFQNCARHDRSLILRHWRRTADDKESSVPTAAPVPGIGLNASETAVALDTEDPSPGGRAIHVAEDGTEQKLGWEDVTLQPVVEQSLEDSAFAKYNVEVAIPMYSDDQYQLLMQNDSWSREETDYLMGLVRAFDLRWPLIWDRYEFAHWSTPYIAAIQPEETKVAPLPGPVSTTHDGDRPVVGTGIRDEEVTALGDNTAAQGDAFPVGTNVPTIGATNRMTSCDRSLEDLKARYYEIAAKVMTATRPAHYLSQIEFDDYQRMSNFKPDWERQRKEMASNAMKRSRDEAVEEEALLLELRRMLLRSDRLEEERRDLYQRLDYPHTDQDISPFKSSAGLYTLLQNLVNSDKSRKRRPLVGTEAGNNSPSSGIPPAGGPASAVTTAAQDGGGSRRDSGVASAGGHGGAGRDLTGLAQTPTSATSRKSGAGQSQMLEQRKLTEQEEMVYGVTRHERLGSGPTFRTEKINKLLSHKSNSQHTRIVNTLTELDVPARLIMPTARVTAHFEQLLNAVNILLDARKLADRLDAEIKLEEARKAERTGAISVDAATSLPRGGTSEGRTVAVPDKGRDFGPVSHPVAHTSSVMATPDLDRNAVGDDARGGTIRKRAAGVLSPTGDRGPKRQRK